MDEKALEYYIPKMRMLLSAMYKYSAMFNGMTMTEFSKRSGVAPSTIKRFLNGTAKTQMKTYEKLAGAFGTTIKDLFGLIDHWQDNLDERSADALGFLFTTDRETQQQFFKSMDYLKAHPGTTLDESLQRFGPVLVDSENI